MGNLPIGEIMPILSRRRRRQQPATPKWSYAEMLQLMPTILRIAEIYDQCSAGPTPATRLARNSGVFPYNGQTYSGLILRTGPFPYALHTPLGLWNLAHANHRSLDVGRFNEHLTLREIRRSTSISIPSLYSITAVEAVQLPEPEPREYWDYVPPIEAEMSWWSIHYKVIEAAKIARGELVTA